MLKTIQIRKMANFNKITEFVVANLEGGYYHPNMLQDGRVKDQRYKNSGETMFGIDRRTGGSINTSAAGKEFWSLIDAADAKDKWKWNYMGGSLAPKLYEYVAQMMNPIYVKLSQTYLTTEAREIVNNSPELTFHFIYATWNGAGWFKKFATAINTAVKEGKTDLIQVAISSRINSGNSLIAQGGSKISKIIKNVPR